MREATDNNVFNNSAMRCGTQLGVLWIIMYASCILGFNNIFFALFFFVLYCASPFYAGYLAASYRNKECGGIISFSRSWMFVLIMYLCASLLAAIAQFIYFRFIDNGYFVEVIQNSTKIILENPEIFGNMAQELETAINNFQAMKTHDIVFSMLSSNMMNGTILAPIIAMFVKRNPETI